jgi:DNA modification methylase
MPLVNRRPRISLEEPFYADDLVTLYCGDARQITAWESGDVLVTDPPYGMSYRTSRGTTIIGDNDTTAREAILHRWGSRPALVFGRWSVPRPEGTKVVLTWDKGDWPGRGDCRIPWGLSTEEIYVLGLGFTGKREGTVLRVPHRPHGRSLHPTQKPVSLMARLIEKTKGVVVDPFAGAGSTLVAAKQLGRRAIGVETDPRYCEAAAQRLAQDVLPF